MSKRLQVLLDEAEFDELREAAGRDGMTISDWVRAALDDARRRRPRKTVESKLRAIEKAMQYQGPTGDIEQVLAEIEQGYLGQLPE